MPTVVINVILQKKPYVFSKLYTSTINTKMEGMSQLLYVNIISRL